MSTAATNPTAPIDDTDDAPPPFIEELPDEALVDADASAPQGQPCDACGCPVEPHDLFCPACGCPREQEQQHEKAVEEDLPEEAALAHIQCKTCGAEITTDPNQRSYVCPFCDSTYVTEIPAETTGRQRPEFVIGFAYTREQALAKFRQWIKQNTWYRPSDLAQAKIEDKLKGVYLPFWSFSMLARSHWAADVGEYWYKTETYTTRDSKGNTVTRTRRVRKTEWWPLAGRHHRFYSGYLVSASKGLSQQSANLIMPFNLPALKRYRPYFLAGWLSEEYSVEQEQAEETCRAEFQRREQANVARFLPGDTHRNLRLQTDFEKLGSDLCLLPIFLLSYRYQDKVYRFMMNGQTGRVTGDKPMSWKKVWTVVGIVGGAILLLVLLIVILSAVLAPR